CGAFGSSSNSASILPVTITSPASPASLSTLPETGEGTSTTALAVSIDTRLSSRRMVSPSLTYHSTMVASGRPSPRSGSRNFLLVMFRSSVGQVSTRHGVLVFAVAVARDAEAAGRDPPYELAIARLAAATILSTLGRYFISSRNSG